MASWTDTISDAAKKTVHALVTGTTGGLAEAATQVVGKLGLAALTALSVPSAKAQTQTPAAIAAPQPELGEIIVPPEVCKDGISRTPLSNGGTMVGVTSKAIDQVIKLNPQVGRALETNNEAGRPDSDQLSRVRQKEEGLENQITGCNLLARTAYTPISMPNS